jgi:hypothetical protein
MRERGRERERLRDSFIDSFYLAGLDGVLVCNHEPDRRR